MSVTAGALSKVLIGSDFADLVSAAATGGTGPYTYQWYRSTVSGFTPGVGNAIAGATSLSLHDTGLQESTAYFYKVVATDTGASNATDTSSQLEVDTAGGQQTPNQFLQSPVVGMLDLRFNPDTVSVQIDVSQSSPLLAGSAVKIVDSADGVPKVVGCSANSDNVLGFINFDVKSQQFVAGDRAEISMDQNVMYLVATTAISRGQQVTLDLLYNGGVAAANSGDTIVGWAYDKAAGPGQLIRVKLDTPSFTLAS